MCKKVFYSFVSLWNTSTTLWTVNFRKAETISGLFILSALEPGWWSGNVGKGLIWCCSISYSYPAPQPVTPTLSEDSQFPQGSTSSVFCSCGHYWALFSSWKMNSTFKTQLRYFLFDACPHCFWWNEKYLLHGLCTPGSQPLSPLCHPDPFLGLFPY